MTGTGPALPRLSRVVPRSRAGRGRVRDGRLVRTRVGLVVDLFHPTRRQVRVDLRRAQALVAEQLLHAAQVGAVVQQVRGEAVTQRVRADARIEAGRHEVLVQLATDRARAQRLAVLVE